MPRAVLLVYALLAASVLLLPAAALLARARASSFVWAAHAAVAVLISLAHARVLDGMVYDGFVPWGRVAAGSLLVLGAPLLVAGAAAAAVMHRRPTTTLPVLLLVTLAASVATVLLTRPAVARLLPTVMQAVQ